MKLLIIADDLSGAADCAIGFANAGYHTIVVLDGAGDAPAAGASLTVASTVAAEADIESVGVAATDDAEVIAADTDTRRLTPAEAAERTVRAFSALAEGRRLYKKIDSTLRGNWAAEVAALQTRAGLAIVAPAFPATGRTVRGGALFVHGVPLDQTETWRLENAGREADMAAMLAAAGMKSERFDAGLLHGDPRALAHRVALIEAEGTRGANALIVDAQSEEDLRALAHATLALDSAFFWVGSGGLARELAKLDAPGATQATSARHCDESASSPKGPILMLVGSLSAVGERQCAMLRERVPVEATQGFLELVIPPAVLRAGSEHEDWLQWRAHIGATLDGHTDLLLRIGVDDAFDPTEGAHFSAMLAELVAPHFTKIGGLIATGGETARAMLDVAGIGSLRLIAEIEAGVAVARPRACSTVNTHRPAVVTKAGAFGTDAALYAAWLHLSNLIHEGTERAAPRS